METDECARTPAEICEPRFSIESVEDEEDDGSASTRAGRTTPTSGKNEPDDDTLASEEGDESRKRKLEAEADVMEEDRLQRSRERNREHARRTRLRKKARLEELKNKAAELEEERRNLTQKLEDRSTADILLGLMSTPRSRGPSPTLSSTSTSEGLKIQVPKGEPAASSGSNSTTSPRMVGMSPTVALVKDPVTQQLR